MSFNNHDNNVNNDNTENNMFDDTCIFTEETSSIMKGTMMEIFEKVIPKFTDIEVYTTLLALNDKFTEKVKRFPKENGIEKIIECCWDYDAWGARLLYNLCPKVYIESLGKELLLKLSNEEELHIEVLKFLLEINEDLDAHFDNNFLYKSYIEQGSFFFEELIKFDNNFSKEELTDLFIHAVTCNGTFEMSVIIKMFPDFDVCYNDNELFKIGLTNRNYFIFEWIKKYVTDHRDIDIRDICTNEFDYIVDNGNPLDGNNVGNIRVLRFIHDLYPGEFDYEHLLQASIDQNNISFPYLEWLLSDDVLSYYEKDCDWNQIKELYILNPFKYFEIMNTLVHVMIRNGCKFDKDIYEKARVIPEFDLDDDDLLTHNGSYITIGWIPISNSGICVDSNYNAVISCDVSQNKDGHYIDNETGYHVDEYGRFVDVYINTMDCEDVVFDDDDVLEY